MASPILESGKSSSPDLLGEGLAPARRRRTLLPISGPASVGGVILLAAYLLAALASFLPLLPDPYRVGVAQQLAGPSGAHWLGTDQLGRDQFARVLLGTRISLEVVLPSALLALVVGTLLGLIAGYFGQIWDNIIMRVVDIFFAFPPVLLALAIIAALGAGIGQLIMAIAIVYAPIFVRVVRGPVLAYREREFVQAAVALGGPPWWIILRHILPTVSSVVIIQMTLTLSWALLTETALSFLGLGLQPPLPDLGTMLSEGSQLVTLDPWLGIFPGLVIMLAVLGFSLTGDALRDALDPAFRRSQEVGIH